MSDRRPWPLALALLGVLLAVAVFVGLQRDSASSIELVARDESAASLGDGAINAGDAAPATAALQDDLELSTEDAASEQSGVGGQSDSAAEPVELPYVDARAIAQATLTDDEFEALVARLQIDPALLAALIDEARAETNPERLQRLLRLLGSVDDPAVVALAAEFVYSGDANLQSLGLDLMKRVRPGDPDVLASVSGLLSSEINGEVLVPALTALARPENTDADTRASLAGQVALLVDHVDPAVRRTSLTILSRWSTDATYTPQLLNALDDVDQSVRRAAAFAFIGREDTSLSVRQRLMQVAADTSNGKSPRRGALLALQGMPLTDAEKEQLSAIERGLNTRPLR